MNGRAGVWLFCLVGLALAACGSGPGRSVPEDSGPFAVQLPPPSTIRSTSYAVPDLFCWGSWYSEALSYNRVTQSEMEARFSPNWTAPGGQFGDLAFAMYQLLLPGYDLNQMLYFSWTEVGGGGNGWVALADFRRDTWEWKPVPPNDMLVFDATRHISTHDEMYVVVLFTGTAPWQLQQLRVGVNGAPADWFMAGHDPQHTRRSPYVGAQAATLKWTYNGGAATISSSPAIGADGTVYVGNGSAQQLLALKPDGSLKWSYTAAIGLSSSPAIGADGTVYVGCDDAKLYAINPDGSLKWSYATGGYVESSPAIGADGTVYVGSMDGFLYAINPDGSLLWAIRPGGGMKSSPAIDGTDGAVYVGSDDGNLYAFEPSGSLRWSYPTGDWVRSSPAIGRDGTIYVGSDDSNLYAIHPWGELDWTYPTGGYVRSSPGIGTDDTIYVGSDDGKLYAINPNGSLNWSYTTGDWVSSSPAIGGDGTVYIGSRDNKVYAIKSDGSFKWSYAASQYATFTSSPAIGEDGTVFIGSSDYLLYAFAGP